MPGVVPTDSRLEEGCFASQQSSMAIGKYSYGVKRSSGPSCAWLRWTDLKLHVMR